MNHIEELIEQLYTSGDKAKEIIPELVKAGICALPLILNAIRNGPTWAKTSLRQAVLQIDDPGMQDEMMILLDDENSYIRSIAYRILSRSNDRHVIDKLEEILVSDEIFNESDKRWAAEALGDGKHSHSLSVLRKQLSILVEDDAFLYSPDLTLALAYSMAQLGDSSALRFVLELCRNEDETVRLSAVKYLRFFSGPGVFGQLKAALGETCSEIRKDAIDALFLIGTKNAAYQIWESCKDENILVAEHAVRRLTQITGKEIAECELIKDFDKWLESEEIGLNDEVCFRSGAPINIPLRVKELTNPQLQSDFFGLRNFLEEFFIITGNRLGYDPEIWFHANPPDYRLIVDSWLEEHGNKYSTGTLYKFSFEQELKMMRE